MKNKSNGGLACHNKYAQMAIPAISGASSDPKVGKITVTKDFFHLRGSSLVKVNRNQWASRNSYQIKSTDIQNENKNGLRIMSKLRIGLRIDDLPQSTTQVEERTEPASQE